MSVVAGAQRLVRTRGHPKRAGNRSYGGSVSADEVEPHDDGAPVAAGAPDGGPFEWLRRGQHLLERGDAAPATVLLEHAAAHAPDSGSVREALARAYYDAGRYEAAAEQFRHLLVLTPASDYGHFGLGLALTRLDRFELAAEHLAMAVAMRPDRSEYVDRLRQARATLAARRAARTDSTT